MSELNIMISKRPVCLTKPSGCFAAQKVAPESFCICKYARRYIFMPLTMIKATKVVWFVHQFLLSLTRLLRNPSRIFLLFNLAQVLENKLFTIVLIKLDFCMYCTRCVIFGIDKTYYMFNISCS